MKITTLYTPFLAATALATPVSLTKRQDIDGDVLQYALTLEHLEDAFYKEALSKWSADDFKKAGFSNDVYNQLEYISYDEATHVLYLEGGLKEAGLMPVEACEYNFNMSSVKDFVSLAATVEGVGVSAYAGASLLITSKNYLNAAASILATEAIHQFALRNAVGELPMANPFGTPIGLNAIYTIASGFITKCPSSNAALPVKGYMGLTVSTEMPLSMGEDVLFKADDDVPSDCYVTYVSGLDVIPCKGSMSDGMIKSTIPKEVRGQSYAFITSNNSGNLTDSNILYGPAILEVNAPDISKMASNSSSMPSNPMMTVPGNTNMSMSTDTQDNAMPSVEAMTNAAASKGSLSLAALSVGVLAALYI
ncbi:unnamed protein product [Debaryomyces tyrocola]|nr:unnamed protein product [Debaryomyces tyrocola]